MINQEAGVRLVVEIAAPDLPAATTEHLGTALREDLQALRHVATAEPVPQPAPEGARDAVALTWAALALALAPVVATVALQELVTFLKSWRRRPGGQPTRIKIVVDERVQIEVDPETVTPAEVEALAETWRRAGRD